MGDISKGSVFLANMIGRINPQEKNVTVIGGGFAGMLAAYAFDRQGYEVTLYEASDRLGGLICTVETEMGISEGAAHSLLVTAPVLEFFRNLGVELIEVSPGSQARYILREGRLCKFPLRFFEAVGVLCRGLFVRSKEENWGQITFQEWSLRFLGRSALNYLITPMLRGIYGASPELLTVRAVFPGLCVPRGYSLFRHLIRSRSTKTERGKMMAPVGGMGSLVRKLEERLRERLKDRLRVSTSIEELPRSGNVVLAVPTAMAAKLLSKQDSRLSQALSEVRSTPLVSVTVFLKKSQLKVIPRGVGVLVPEVENRRILGILFNSSSFEGRVKSQDWISCTVLLGGSGQPEMIEASDESLKQIIRDEFQSIFGLEGDLGLCLIWRRKSAVPQYGKHVLELWKIAESGWCSAPGNILFGNYTGQVSLRGMIERMASSTYGKEN